MTLLPPDSTDPPVRSDAAIAGDKPAHDVTEPTLYPAPPPLFHRSSRVYYWGALTGNHRGLRFDPELPYAGVMFHDMDPTPRYLSTSQRPEAGAADAARAFLQRHRITNNDIGMMWTTVALHTAPGIPPRMHPVITLMTVYPEMGMLGIAFSAFTDAAREAGAGVSPRGGRFREEIIQAFYDGIHHRPDRTFGNVNADAVAAQDRFFQIENFCRVIRASAWPPRTDLGHKDNRPSGS
jgi:hypothetical protein